MFTVSPSYFCLMVSRPAKRWPHRVQRKSARKLLFFKFHLVSLRLSPPHRGQGKRRWLFSTKGLRRSQT